MTSENEKTKAYKALEDSYQGIVEELEDTKEKLKYISSQHEEQLKEVMKLKAEAVTSQAIAWGHEIPDMEYRGVKVLLQLLGKHVLKV